MSADDDSDWSPGSDNAGDGGDVDNVVDLTLDSGSDGGGSDDGDPSAGVDASTSPTTARRRSRLRRTGRPADAGAPRADVVNTPPLSSRTRRAAGAAAMAAITSDSGGGGEVESGEDDGDGDRSVVPLKREDERQPKSASDGRPKQPRSSSTEASYLTARKRGVQVRSFDLRRIPPLEVIPTGRTIKKMPSWGGHWPALREFLQNTIDHLGLLDPKTGRRHSAVRLEVTAGGDGTDTAQPSSPPLATFRFVCRDEAMCTITARDDELVIEQLYTFPIAPRALDTGVPDTTKATSDSAGGFGDGFKTAAVALLALGKDFRGLEWHFVIVAGPGGERSEEVKWTFEGVTRPAVGAFARCKVLQVRVERTSVDREAGASGYVDHEPSYSGKGRDHVMRQIIQVRGIGKSFVEQAVPRLQVFWDLDPSTLVASAAAGGDCLGPANEQPPIGGGVLRTGPAPGVYVRGIYVRQPKVAGAIMSFFGRRLQVTGRDRNDVDDDDLVEAVAYVFRRCADREGLRRLLAPLQGTPAGRIADGSESCGVGGGCSGSRRGTRRDGGGNWLLTSPRFLNRLLERHRDFILHDVLAVPRGAIFVSSRTTKSQDPFIKWASSFLRKRGAPLVPIEPGANRYLFEEVSEAELTERCVKLLTRDVKKTSSEAGCSVEVLRRAFRKILVFMGLGGGVRGGSVGKILFSPDVVVAFVHGRHVFVPEAPLTRELIIKVLNVCQCHLNGADGERFSSIVQAIFETLPPGAARQLTEEDVDGAVSRAKEVRKENASFLTKTCSSGRGVAVAAQPPAATLVGETSMAGRAGGGCGDHNEGGQRVAQDSSEDLERQIANTVKGSRKRKHQGAGDDGLEAIIPEAEFEQDNSGQDCCLRSSSSLQSLTVNESLGGGSLLCDAATAEKIRSGTLPFSTRERVAVLRSVLVEAVEVVRRCIPSLDPLLTRIRHGYDAANDTYEAFCDGRQIVVNLHAYLQKARGVSANAPRPRTLIHDLIITVTHELAHFLEPRAGHGPIWRDTHMRMVMEVMAMFSSKQVLGGLSVSSKRSKRG